ARVAINRRREQIRSLIAPWGGRRNRENLKTMWKNVYEGRANRRTKIRVGARRATTF
ncbi:hypothetical protein Bbelb_443430, partial [Branchiostoma belcheri]